MHLRDPWTRAAVQQGSGHPAAPSSDCLGASVFIFTPSHRETWAQRARLEPAVARVPEQRRSLRSVRADSVPILHSPPLSGPFLCPPQPPSAPPASSHSNLDNCRWVDGRVASRLCLEREASRVDSLLPSSPLGSYSGPCPGHPRRPQARDVPGVLWWAGEPHTGPDMTPAPSTRCSALGGQVGLSVTGFLLSSPSGWDVPRGVAVRRAGAGHCGQPSVLPLWPLWPSVWFEEKGVHFSEPLALGGLVATGLHLEPAQAR